MNQPRIFLSPLATIAAGAFLLAIAGCGGSDDGSAEAEPTTTVETTAADPAKLDAAVRRYDAFVERNAAELAERTEEFVAAVEAGEWGGYHWIETALWIDGSTEGLEPITKELLSDVTNLEGIAVKADFDPAEIAQGSVDLLGEVSASKITGEEERYSRTDLWDFEANVAGAEAGFEALAPALREVDPELADEVAEQFADTYAALDDYRRGDGFVLYYELSTDDTAVLSQRIDALAEPLSRVSATVN